MGDAETEAVHKGFMKAALEQAEEAYEALEVPVGCVFVRDGTIIGRGRNRTNEQLNGTRHAEMCAIDDILASHPSSVFVETDLYVTVEPCVMCASALRLVGIRKVLYGCGNDKFGGCGSVFNVHSSLVDEGRPYAVQGGYFREEAIMMLRKFYVRENDHAPATKKTRKTNRVLKPVV
ncbi:cytidine deaminase-like protein [Gaertneriomyces semiglobifer]|nr:cytidine deaminase-like protein [Gaertneriomyces semiglobifer]